MSQHTSAQTVIGSGVQLILLDCYETLVELRKDRYQARLGVHRFLAHFRRHLGVPCVVISDGVAEQVMQALLQASLATEVSAVYHAGNALETFADGRVRKRLDRPLADFRVRAEQAVFIGDSQFDQAAAAHHHVPFIRVPRSEDIHFSLDRLIIGPSNYRSGEFELGFLQHYGREKAP